MSTRVAHLDRIREVVAATRGAGRNAPGRIPESASTAAPDPDQVARALGGRLEDASDGACLVVRRTYPAASRYGRRRLEDYPVLSCDSGHDALDVLAGSGAGYRRGTGPIIALDLETTGLSGGAGTLPFLVGLGWFDRRAFHTCQYFLSALTGERRILAAVADVLGRAGTLLTFNGRSFDVPIIDSRWSLHRMRSPLSELMHVDLLHPARWLWRANETRLVTLERTVLGVRRVGDVPGPEIPGRYVAYLRGGALSLLEPVLEHNRLDLVSLGVLTAVVCQLVRDGAPATGSPGQALGLGRLFDKAGLPRRALDCYECAAGVDGDAAPSARCTTEVATRAEALRRLACSYRRSGRHAEAAETWRRLLTLTSPPVHLWREAAVALAVHHEHRQRDLLTARQLARRAFDAEGDPRHRRSVEHRLRRLGRKIEESDEGRGLMPSLVWDD